MTLKGEVLNLIELLEFEIRHMRDEGESDLRPVLDHIGNLYANVDRLEEDGEYHNG